MLCKTQTSKLVLKKVQNLEFEGIVFGHFSRARIFHFQPGKSKILTIIFLLFTANLQNMEYKQEEWTFSLNWCFLQFQILWMRSRDVVILSHGNTVFTSDTRVEVGPWFLVFSAEVSREVIVMEVSDKICLKELSVCHGHAMPCTTAPSFTVGHS